MLNKTHRDTESFLRQIQNVLPVFDSNTLPQEPLPKERWAGSRRVSMSPAASRRRTRCAIRPRPGQSIGISSVGTWGRWHLGSHLYL